MKDEYIASMYARTVLKEMGLRIGMRPDQIKEKLTGRYPDEDLMYEVVSGIALSGYMEYRQVYVFSGSLIKELEESSLDFRIRDLHMPFESFFIDLKNYTGTLGGKKVLGAFIRNIGNPEKNIFFEFLLREQNGAIDNMQACMSYNNDKTLEEQVQRIYGGYTGEGRLCRLILTLMAYISSDEPDVKDKGKQYYTVKRRDRTIPTSVRFWDVGYRYFTERKAKPSVSTGNPASHASPRPHIRRGHWHTYRCGPGRTQVKIRWIREQKIGKGQIVDVLRKEKI